MSWKKFVIITTTITGSEIVVEKLLFWQKCNEITVMPIHPLHYFKCLAPGDGLAFAFALVVVQQHVHIIGYAACGICFGVIGMRGSKKHNALLWISHMKKKQLLKKMISYTRTFCAQTQVGQKNCFFGLFFFFKAQILKSSRKKLFKIFFRPI